MKATSDRVLAALRSKGYEKIAAGSQGAVAAKPGRDYVVKFSGMTENRDAWPLWALFCASHRHLEAVLKIGRVGGSN